MEVSATRLSAKNVVMCEGARKLRRQDILDLSTPEPNSGCWLWTGAQSRAGYGLITIYNVAWRAHRLSYEAFRGPIPEHLEIDHLCRVPSCVNPDHLEAVTHAENVVRGDSGKLMAAKTHCPHGHPYSGDNLYINPRGHRECRTCKRNSVKKRTNREW